MAKVGWRPFVRLPSHLNPGDTAPKTIHFLELKLVSADSVRVFPDQQLHQQRVNIKPQQRLTITG
jgi:hypothetical protein